MVCNHLTLNLQPSVPRKCGNKAINEMVLEVASKCLGLRSSATLPAHGRRWTQMDGLATFKLISRAAAETGSGGVRRDDDVASERPLSHDAFEDWSTAWKS